MRTLLASASLLVLGSTAVTAADLPAKSGSAARVVARQERSSASGIQLCQSRPDHFEFSLDLPYGGAAVGPATFLLEADRQLYALCLQFPDFVSCRRA